MVHRRLGSSRAEAEWGDVLELQGLTRRYGDLVALDDLPFTVAEGQMFGFVGPNGAGKTTAMRIILGVLAPDAGEVRWRGQPMNDEIRKHIGYLPEDHGHTFLQRFAADRIDLVPITACDVRNCRSTASTVTRRPQPFRPVPRGLASGGARSQPPPRIVSPAGGWQDAPELKTWLLSSGGLSIRISAVVAERC
jgi:ABC transporter